MFLASPATHSLPLHKHTLAPLKPLTHPLALAPPVTTLHIVNAGSTKSLHVRSALRIPHLPCVLWALSPCEGG